MGQDLSPPAALDDTSALSSPQLPQALIQADLFDLGQAMRPAAMEDAKAPPVLPDACAPLPTINQYLQLMTSCTDFPRMLQLAQECLAVTQLSPGPNPHPRLPVLM